MNLTELHFRPVVYFVATKTAIKIGYSCDLVSRLNCLKAGAPDELELLGVITLHSVDEAHKKERQLHRQFAKYRMHHEWFRRDPKIETFITRNHNATTPEPWCRIGALVPLTGLSLTTLKQYVAEDKIPSTRVSSKITIFKRSRVVAALALLTACGGVPHPPKPLVQALVPIAKKIAGDLRSL